MLLLAQLLLSLLYDLHPVLCIITFAPPAGTNSNANTASDKTVTCKLSGVADPAM